MKNKLKQISRRDIIKYFVIAFAIISSSFAILFGKKRSKVENNHLRLPGATAEKDFLVHCIKCGQCVQVCPYNAVRLLDITDGFALGTPVIDPERRGCYLCDLLPCVLSCPSGALDHKISFAEDVKMGKATVTNPEYCYGMLDKVVTIEDIDRVIAHGVQTDVEKELIDKLNKTVGKKCRICVEFCPYPDLPSAITLVDNNSGYYPLILDKCVGCGVCVELCPSKKVGFKIVPNRG